jgi:hypothetical protein
MTNVGEKSCMWVVGMQDGDMKSKKQQEKLGSEERLRIDECLGRAKLLP